VKVGTVEKLADDAAAVAALEAMRKDVEKGCGRAPILAAIDHCFANGIPVPPWLQLPYRRRFAGLRACDFLTLDEAFGRWWKKRTRRETEKRNIVLRTRVHGVAFALIQANPARSIRAAAFWDEVGAAPGINLSAGAAKARYYEALRDGAVNLATFRWALADGARAFRVFKRKRGTALTIGPHSA